MKPDIGSSFSFAIWHGYTVGWPDTLQAGLCMARMRGGHIGYWIDKNFANRGYTTQGGRNPYPVCL